MFLGHFGVAFGAKRVAPKVSLGAFFLAAQFIDLLWPTLLMLGVEQVRIRPDAVQHPPLDFIHYPYSHSLLMVCAWAALVALIHFGLRRSLAGAVTLAALVLSHWVLDLLVHRPDLPLYPGSPYLAGLGLWAMPVVSMLLELALFAGGLLLYLRSTRAVDAIGKWALWALAAFLVVIAASDAVGPPPPSVEALAWVAQAQWLLVLWGYWVDRHRRPLSGA